MNIIIIFIHVQLVHPEKAMSTNVEDKEGCNCSCISDDIYKSVITLYGDNCTYFADQFTHSFALKKLPSFNVWSLVKSALDTCIHSH